MKPHLSVLDPLSKALRRAVDPLFFDVDQMQRGRFVKRHPELAPERHEELTGSLILPM
jgi:hypothetical protein